MEQEKKIVEENSEKNKRRLKIIVIVFVGIISIMVLFLLYARYIATSGIYVKEYKITNELIPSSMHGTKIVHISDIHYGRITFEKQMKNLVNKINLIKPDIVILSGDLIDKDTKLTKEKVDILTEALKKIEVTVGKYAIKGNHDYTFSEWDSIITNSNFINLNDTFDTVYKGSNDYILLSGMSTNLNGQLSVQEKLSSTQQYLESVLEENQPNYKILVLHEPDFIDSLDLQMWDLILAGHSHNGQVRFPFIGAIFLPVGSKKYHKPYYKINQTDIYISSGIGVSMVNFRLWNRPSFNLYRLTNY